MNADTAQRYEKSIVRDKLVILNFYIAKEDNEKLNQIQKLVGKRKDVLIRDVVLDYIDEGDGGKMLMKHYAKELERAQEAKKWAKFKETVEEGEKTAAISQPTDTSQPEAQRPTP